MSVRLQLLQEYNKLPEYKKKRVQHYIRKLTNSSQSSFLYQDIPAMIQNTQKQSSTIPRLYMTNIHALRQFINDMQQQKQQGLASPKRMNMILPKHILQSPPSQSTTPSILSYLTPSHIRSLFATSTRTNRNTSRALSELEQLKINHRLKNPKQFVKKLSTFKSLTILNLEEYHLNDTDATTIANALPLLPKLKVLNLRMNRIKNKGLRDISQKLESLANLRVLNLSYNRITHMDPLFEVLPKLKKLEELYLSNNYIFDSSYLFATKMIHLSSLKILKLGDTFQEDSISQLFLENLRKLPTLQSLHLDNLNIRENQSHIILASSLQHLTNLTELSLYDCSLQNNGVAVIAASLQYTPLLKHLSIGYNNIHWNGISAISSVFQYIPLLEYLEMIDSNIDTDEELNMFLPRLSTLSNLKYLNLSDNTIGLNPQLFASSISHLHQLETLHIGMNAIYDDDFIIIAEALCNLKNLHRLDISYNSELTDDCVDSLVQVINELPRIIELDISHTSFTNTGVQRISQAMLRHKKHLSLFSVSSDLISQATYRSLQQQFGQKFSKNN